MQVFKCKRCGGDLDIDEGDLTGTCQYCGTKQTLPKSNDEKIANLYDRANHYRRTNEFDKAEDLFEKILEEDSTDPEAYWSLLLCKYGIEYVEDRRTHKRIPTINRTQHSSILSDDDYKSALKYADYSQKELYESEANEIDKIQKGILDIAKSEKPYDVFICYKETDDSGRRTHDSVLANDLYHELTEEGFKVFFSRITLEDKLGEEYEPYIFAALNSAKVMVVIGTKSEYFNSPWVKNEWSRYLKLPSKDRILIPAYKDMDPYDLPEEFSHLQAQDMTKLGFMQDLIRGIKKLSKQDVGESNNVVGEQTAGNVKPILKRLFLFLEDQDWESAKLYSEKVLDINPECADAYLGKLLYTEKSKSTEEFIQNYSNYSYDVFASKFRLITSKQFYKRIAGFSKGSDLSAEFINNFNAVINIKYNDAIKQYENASSITDYDNLILVFNNFGDYKNSVNYVEKCDEGKSNIAYSENLEKFNNAQTIEDIFTIVENLRGLKETSKICELLSSCDNKLQDYYVKANDLLNNGNDIKDYLMAKEMFASLKGYKNSDELLNESEDKISICKKQEISNLNNEISELDKDAKRINNNIKLKNNVLEYRLVFLGVAAGISLMVALVFIISSMHGLDFVYIIALILLCILIYFLVKTYRNKNRLKVKSEERLKEINKLMDEKKDIIKKYEKDIL